MKSLDKKLKTIAAGKYKPADFILADAKDPEYAFGVRGTGAVDYLDQSGPHRSIPQFRDTIRAIVKQKQMDIMLASVSNIEALAAEGLFDKSAVTPAVRANDTTDIWLPRGANFSKEPSRPWRTANLSHVRKFCDLGLYSVTFNNILDRDYASVEAYREFREDAVKNKFRHFLEVFNPNAPQNLDPEMMPFFVNDMIVRVLTGTTRAERPLFLKMPFNGRRAMEELASHDPALVIGILGGSAGTTRDCFELLSQGEKSGARVALFGRKINLAESPLDLVALFRPVLESAIKPDEAVRAYHATLAKKNLKPKRKLEDDMKITEAVLEGYGK
ncbi:hypothetical protein [Aestuariivirga sp.]|uniref:hypothetical protein n=1 Tax=Aestuariivirga sp. TaxID=2650926 RepID=UPI0035935156